MTLLALATNNKGHYYIVQDRLVGDYNFDNRDKAALGCADKTIIKVGLAGEAYSVDHNDIMQMFLDLVDFEYLRSQKDKALQIALHFNKAFRKFADEQGKDPAQVTIMIVVQRVSCNNLTEIIWQEGYVYNKDERGYSISFASSPGFIYAWGSIGFLHRNHSGNGHGLMDVEQWKKVVKRYHKAVLGFAEPALVI